MVALLSVLRMRRRFAVLQSDISAHARYPHLYTARAGMKLKMQLTHLLFIYRARASRFAIRSDQCS